MRGACRIPCSRSVRSSTSAAIFIGAIGAIGVLGAGQASAQIFIRGRVNADAGIDLGDPIFLLNYQFASGPAPTCIKSADIDDNGGLTIGDAIMLLNYQFASGPAPAAPFAQCGEDKTPDPLTCVSSAACPR